MIKFSFNAMNYYETGYQAKSLEAFSDVMEDLNLNNFFDRNIFFVKVNKRLGLEEYGIAIKKDSPVKVHEIIQYHIEKGNLKKIYEKK